MTAHLTSRYIGAESHMEHSAMTSHTVAIAPELDDMVSTKSAYDHPSPEYLEFLRHVVDQAMISVREGRGRSNEEVNAYFAAKYARLIAGQP